MRTTYTAELACPHPDCPLCDHDEIRGLRPHRWTARGVSEVETGARYLADADDAMCEGCGTLGVSAEDMPTPLSFLTANITVVDAPPFLLSLAMHRRLVAARKRIASEERKLNPTLMQPDEELGITLLAMLEAGLSEYEAVSGLVARADGELFPLLAPAQEPADVPEMAEDDWEKVGLDYPTSGRANTLTVEQDEIVAALAIQFDSVEVGVPDIHGNRRLRCRDESAPGMLQYVLTRDAELRGA
jgi:hypothetical protein